jgi:hypothetical protein
LIEFINLYVSIFKDKKAAINKQIAALKNGIGKIQLLNNYVENTKNELQTLKPLLQKVADDAKRLEEAIGKNSKTVEDSFKAVREEELAINAKNNESAQMVEEAKKAQEEFDKVVPALNAAIAGTNFIIFRANYYRTSFSNEE